MFFLFLFILLLLPPQHVSAQGAENLRVLQCQGEEFQNPQDDAPQMRCNVTLKDTNDTTLSPSTIHILIKGTGYETAPPAGLGSGATGINVGYDVTSNPFPICAYYRTEDIYPHIDKVTISAPGYKSTTVSVDPDGCGDLNDPIILEAIPKGTRVHTCSLKNIVPGDTSSCVSIDASECTDPNLCFEDVSCDDKCGLYFQVKDIDGTIHCYDVEVAKTMPEVMSGAYATMEKCNSDLAAGQAEPVPTIPPRTPTPTPPLHLCQTSADTPQNCDTALGILRTTPDGFIQGLLGILLSISGMVALYLIIRSGYQIMTSRGNPETLSEARERLTSALIGLLFVILSLLIMSVIGVDLFKIPGFSN